MKMVNIKECHSKVIIKTDILLLEDNFCFVKITQLAQRLNCMIGTPIAPNVIGHLLSKLFHIAGPETVGLVTLLMYPTQVVK